MAKGSVLKSCFKQFIFESDMCNSCITYFNRKFGYVDFASEEDMQKALELNGKKFMGQELKLDRARSKENSQEGKKGKSCFYIEIPVHTWGSKNRTNIFQEVMPGTSEFC